MSNVSQQSSHRPRKLFIQMSGAPGSRKSTTAKLLAQSIDGVVIDHDIIRSSVLEHQISFEEVAKLAYDLSCALAESIIQQERSIIIDSTCNYKEILEQGAALAQKYGCDYWYVECKVDDVDVLDGRLRKRVPLRSQRRGVDRPPPDASTVRGSEDPRALFKRWIECPCRPDGNAIVVDSTGRPEKCRDDILERIRPPIGVQASDLVLAPKSCFREGESRA